MSRLLWFVAIWAASTAVVIAFAGALHWLLIRMPAHDFNTCCRETSQMP